MFLLVPAHPGFPGQIPQSRKTVVCVVCVCVLSWEMCKLEVEEWLVLAVMSMYTGAKTAVRIVYGTSKCFEVKVVCTKVQH